MNGDPVPKRFGIAKEIVFNAFTPDRVAGYVIFKQNGKEVDRVSFDDALPAVQRTLTGLIGCETIIEFCTIIGQDDVQPDIVIEG